MLIIVKTKIMSNDFLQYIFTNCFFFKVLRKISTFLDSTFFLAKRNWYQIIFYWTDENTKRDRRSGICFSITTRSSTAARSPYGTLRIAIIRWLPSRGVLLQRLAAFWSSLKIKNQTFCLSCLSQKPWKNWNSWWTTVSRASFPQISGAMCYLQFKNISQLFRPGTLTTCRHLIFPCSPGYLQYDGWTFNALHTSRSVTSLLSSENRTSY